MKIPVEELFRDIHNRSYVWLYEGRNNGWWYYDYDMQDILEEAWHNGQTEDGVFLDWLICGQKVNIDLFNMQQTNSNNNAVRAIKRININDINSTDLLIKGVAGMMP